MPAMSAARSVLESASLRSALPNPRPLFSCVDRKPGQEHHRYRVPWQALADPNRCPGMFDGAHDQTVIPHDPEAPAHDIRARAAGFLIDEGEPLEEVIQGRLSAVERLRRCDGA